MGLREMKKRDEILKKVEEWKKKRREEKNKEKSLPGGHIIASGGLDSSLRVWSLRDGKEVKKLNNGQIYSLDWHPKRNVVALGTGEKTVEVWDIEQGTLNIKFKEHSSFVNSIQWEEKGERFASAAGDGTARIWHPSEGSVAVLRGHNDYLLTEVVWINSEEVVTSAMDKTIKVWSVTEEKETDEIRVKKKKGIISRKTLSPTSLAWNRKEELLAVGTKEGDIQVLDSNWKRIEELHNAHNGPVSSLQFNRAGNLLLSGAFDSFTKVWRIKKGVFDLDSGETEPLEKELAKHGGSVYSVGWSYDGKWVASSGEDASIVVWDTQEWSAVDIRGHRFAVLAFSIRPSRT